MSLPEDRPSPGDAPEPRGKAESRSETWYDDDSIFYWMERDEERGLEPLSYLGTFFPHGCRFCM